jgi:hypothetical protein
MKRPTWATVIGIIMITFGGCSVLNDIQAIRLPAKLEEKRISLQAKMKESETSSIDSLSITRADSANHQNEITKSEEETKFDLAKNALTMPESTQVWIVRLGYIGLFIATIYILGGIFLLVPKKNSIKLAYGALILSIAFSATKTLILTSTGSASGVIALTMGATQLFSIIIDIILLSVVFAAEDKAAYTS